MYVADADAAEDGDAGNKKVSGQGRAGAQDRDAGGDAGAGQQRGAAERHAQSVDACGGGDGRSARRSAAGQAGGTADSWRCPRGLGLELP